MREATSITAEKSPERSGSELTFRPPTVDDGAEICDLVAACPPLDRNSLYCNLLQCTDFAETCLIAEDGAKPIGWVSGYRPPAEPSTLFIWQVAVAREARGIGLARTMILSLLERPACSTVDRIKTTITPDNEASWALFESVADALNGDIERQPWFDQKIHFRGRHDSEHLVTIRFHPAAG